MKVGYLDELAKRARDYYEKLGETVQTVTIDIGREPSSMVIKCKGGISYVHTIEAFEEL